MFRCQSYIYIYSGMLNFFIAMRSKFVSSPSISAMWKNLNKYSNDRHMKDPWMTVRLFSTAFHAVLWGNWPQSYYFCRLSSVENI